MYKIIVKPQIGNENLPAVNIGIQGKSHPSLEKAIEAANKIFADELFSSREEAKLIWLKWRGDRNYYDYRYPLRMSGTIDIIEVDETKPRKSRTNSHKKV